MRFTGMMTSRSAAHLRATTPGRVAQVDFVIKADGRGGDREPPSSLSQALDGAADGSITER